MNEVWVDINGYEGLYKISKSGFVKSMAKTWICGTNTKRSKPDTMLSICKTTEYHNVRLHKTGLKSKFCHIHRLIAEHFIPNPENKREVNHINGDKHDNRIENLEWVTSSENRQHAFDIGLKKAAKGSEHWNCKPIMIIYLKSNRTISFPTMKMAAKETGIGETTMYYNLRGIQKSWNHRFEYL